MNLNMKNRTIIGIGLIVGIFIFAVTDQPVWIAAGLIVGAAIAIFMQRRDGT